MYELLALAERIEAAADNDPELFEDAFLACFQKPERVWITDNNGHWTEEYSAWHKRQLAFFGFLDVGACLDAAMQLVPEGWWLGSVSQADPLNSLSFCYACIVANEFGEIDPFYDLYVIEAKAATPALALCAASLKAQAKQGGK